jgi:hypothetical protein
MSAYLIWNPTIVEGREPPTLEMVVTDSDSDQIADGTDQFVVGLLRDLEIDLTPTRWRLTTYRSLYYSDYLDDGWEGRWPVVRKVRVELPATPYRLPIARYGWIHTNATDASWTPEKHSLNLRSARCLVVADFANAAALERAKAVVIAAHTRGEVGGALTFACADAFGAYPQLQIDMGDFPNAFYEDGAVDAEKVIRLLDQAGGSTNHNATLKRHESRS